MARVGHAPEPRGAGAVHGRVALAVAACRADPLSLVDVPHLGAPYCFCHFHAEGGGICNTIALHAADSSGAFGVGMTRPGRCSSISDPTSNFGLHISPTQKAKALA